MTLEQAKKVLAHLKKNNDWEWDDSDVAAKELQEAVKKVCK